MVDTRSWGKWRSGHVPGAHRLPWTSMRDGLLRTGRLDDDLDALTATLRGAGISNDVPVLVTGAGGQGWGEEGRVFWTLEYLGHPAVYVLDGGVAAWERSGRALSTDRPDRKEGTFTPDTRPDRRARIDEVAAAIEDGDVVIWDTRGRHEYDGATPYLEPRGGHIPTAVHLWYRQLTDEHGILLPEEELERRLAAHGITRDKEIITVCTAGVRSGFAYAVLRELEFDEASNYDGSMWEWSGDRDRPLE